MSTAIWVLRAVVLAVLATSAPLSAQATDCTGYDSQIWAQSVFETDLVGPSPRHDTWSCPDSERSL